MESVEFNIGEMTAFKELLLRTCGLGFENDRAKALASAVKKRMTVCGLQSSGDYRNLMSRNKDEFNRLVELLTVNETYFFREQEHLRLVTDRLSDELLTRAGAGRPVRIVSAGCSTGEEPYSIAILLRERFGPESARLFSITGIDIDAAAIGTAGKGVYGKGSFRGADEVIVRRYFEPCGQSDLRIRKEIREQVTFEAVNLLSGPFPAAMLRPDVIFYRNVSIYFPSHVQREIFTRLAGLLDEGGCLIVGATETIHHDIGILTLVEREGIFFYRKLPGVFIEERRAVRREAPRQDRTLTTPPRPAGTNPGRSAAARKPSVVPAAVDVDVRELFDRAVELAANGRTGEALKVLEALNDLNRTFVKAYTLKGCILLGASSFDDARGPAEAALSLDPFCIEALLMLGIIARHEGNDDEACKRFREAIYLDPACWPAHFHMAETAFGRNDRKRARSAYSMALEILENGAIAEHGRDFFPLVVKAEQFLVICRHKLSLLKENG